MFAQNINLRQLTPNSVFEATINYVKFSKKKLKYYLQQYYNMSNDKASDMDWAMEQGKVVCCI